MDSPIQVGSKGRHLQILEGYERVTEGLCQAGDLFADHLNLTWTPAEADDVGMPVEAFTALIRRDERGTAPALVRENRLSAP
jgi:hypothetical protein